jgi:hypothetical protein
MAGFYGMRLVIQNLFLMKKADGYIWEYPGFPSLVVPYGQTNDFFYSGHMGGSFIATLEWGMNGYRSMSIFGILTMIVTFWLMVFCQAHFLIDMFAGVIIAHWCFSFATKYSPYFDRVIC